MFGMPRFFLDMPPKESPPKEWVAVVISTSFFRPPREVFTKRVKGLRRAYICARLHALRLDFKIPYCDGEVGIEWAVREPNEHDSKV